MLKLCETNQAVRVAGVHFVDTIEELMQRLLEYRDVVHDEIRENKMSCTVNLLVSPSYEAKILQSNLSSRDTVTRGHPVIRGRFVMSYLPHDEVPAMKGHLSFWGTFSGI